MFKLPPQLTIAELYNCQSQLLEFINVNDEISLNSDDVEKIDTLGVQFLVAVVTYISSQNKKLIWHCHSTAIKNTMIQLGINEPLLQQHIAI